MDQDNSSQKSFSSASSQGHNGPRLNKPLPPINKVGSINGLPTNRVVITGGCKVETRHAAPYGHQRTDAQNPALFTRLTKPRAQLARGHTAPVTGAAAFPFKISKPIPLGTVTTREDQARLDAATAPVGAVEKKAPPRPMAPLDSQADARVARVCEELDTSHPPTFREVLALAAKIAPAMTVIKSRTTTIMSMSTESRRASRALGPDLAGKIFVLARSGFLLQYADRGSSERLPERIQSLTKDTVAVASDLVPGKPYTIQIAESYDMEDLSRPESPALRNKFGIKGAAPKRAIPCTIMVLSSSGELEQWLLALRKEIRLLVALSSQSPATSSTPDNAKRKTVIDYETSYPPPLRLTKSQTNLRVRNETSALSSKARPVMLSAIPAVHARSLHEDSDDTDEYDIPTVREMYHRDLLQVRQDARQNGHDSRVPAIKFPLELPAPPEPPRQVEPARTIPRASMVSTMTREGILEITYDPMPVIPTVHMKIERSMSVPRLDIARDSSPSRQPQAVPVFSPLVVETASPAPRKDSLVTDNAETAAPVAHVVNTRKRLTHTGNRPAPPRSQTHSDPITTDPMTSGPMTSGPIKTKTKIGVAVHPVKEGMMREIARLDNDEYHDFQQDLYLGKPSAFKPENFSRRHSLVYGPRYRTVNTSMMARPRGASVTEMGVRVPIKNDTARLPLRGRSQTQPLIRSRTQAEPGTQPARFLQGSVLEPSTTPAERQYLRPGSTKIRNDTSMPADRLTRTYESKNGDKSDPMPGKERTRHLRSRSGVSSDEDENTILPIQSTSELFDRPDHSRPASQVGRCPGLRLGPPMGPPPMTPLPPRPYQARVL